VTDFVGLCIQAAHRGAIPVEQLLWVVSGAEFVILVTPESAQSGDRSGVAPQIITDGKSQFVLLYTSQDFVASGQWRSGNFSTVRGFQVFANLPDGVGLVINPETAQGFEMSAPGVSAFKQKLRPVIG
jgi:hypothetical protein